MRSPIPPALVDSGLPYVLALRSSGRHLSVTADDESGGGQVAEHLLGLAHRNICVIAGPRSVVTAAHRLRGFSRALEAAEVRLPPGRVVHSEFGVREGHAAMAGLLDAGHRPTAVFALNDYNAIGAGRALQDRGLLPGRDVALVGYNDVAISAELPVPLSTVHNDLEAVGRLAVRTLVRLLDGEIPRSVVVAPQLVIRESSAGVGP